MKKLFLIAVAACMLPLAAYAQETKAAKVYLPEQGDWSIGFNAAPLFKYVGNLFNGTSGNTLESLGGQPITDKLEGYEKGDIAPDISIMGKYMLTDEWALRANVGFMVRSTMNKSYVADDKAVALDPLSESKVLDQEKLSNHGASLMLGAEYRKGKKRVQGVFGMGLLFGLKQTKSSYTYGNAVTSLNQCPTSAWYNGEQYRIDKQKSASDVFFGVMGSAGVEWFVAPKISLGAEVNLSLYYIFGGQEWTTSTGYNATLGKVEQRTDITSPGSDSFRFGTHNLGGSMHVSFYF
jgi:hypothetical protein